MWAASRGVSHREHRSVGMQKTNVRILSMWNENMLAASFQSELIYNVGLYNTSKNTHRYPHNIAPARHLFFLHGISRLDLRYRKSGMAALTRCSSWRPLSSPNSAIHLGTSSSMLRFRDDLSASGALEFIRVVMSG